MKVVVVGWGGERTEADAETEGGAAEGAPD